MKYTKEIKRMMSEVKAVDGVEVLDEYVGLSVKRSNLEIMLKRESINVDEELMSYYMQVNGFFFHWNTNVTREIKEKCKLIEDDSEMAVVGKIDFLLMQEMLVGHQDMIDFISLENDDIISSVDNFRPFDRSNDEFIIGFIVEEGVIKNKMYGFSQHYGLIDFSCGIVDYFKAAMQSKGYFGWQYLFAFRNRKNTQSTMDCVFEFLFPSEKLESFYLRKITK